METSETSETSHPGYPNPTVREATVFITFVLPPDNKKPETVFADFYDRIGRQQYPVFFPSLEQVVSVGTQEGSSQLRTPIRYRSQYNDVEIAFDGYSLAVAVVSAYKGWGELRTAFLDIWQKAKSVVEPERVTSIGLRYSNRVQKRSDKETLTDWLAPSSYVPATLLEQTTGESTANLDYWRLLEPFLADYTVLAFTSSNASEEIPGSFQFEINRFRFFGREYGNNQLLEQERLQECVDGLHDEVWTIFRASKNETLEKLLQGEIL